MTRSRTWDVEEAFDSITAGETTLRQFAVKAKVSPAAVSKGLISRYGHDWQGPKARHYGRLPWVLPAPHHASVEASRLRWLLRREAGETLEPGDDARLNNFLALIPPGFVLAFDALGRRGAGSWVYRKRQDWEQDGEHIFNGVMAKEAHPDEP